LKQKNDLPDFNLEEVPKTKTKETMSKLYQAVFYGVAAEYRNRKKGLTDGLFVFLTCGYIHYVIYIPPNCEPFRIFQLRDDGKDAVRFMHGILQCFVQRKTNLLRLVNKSKF